MVEKLLTTSEAAELLRLKTNSLEVWRCQGRGPRFIKLEGAVRYRLEDLKDYLECRTKGIIPRNA
jgi:predicted site-specific integrase-resolvase